MRIHRTQSVAAFATGYHHLPDGYGMAGQIGLEETPAEFVGRLVEVFREVRRVLRNDGTAWVNMGDTYASIAGGYSPGGSAGKHDMVSQATRGAVLRGKRRSPPIGLKQKDLMGIPWRLAFALQDDGWYLRQDIIWHKPNPMPESTIPPDLIRPCILAGAPLGGIVLDPFGGSGTTAVVAMQEGRKSILCELNPEYSAMAERRIAAAWLDGAAQMDVFRDTVQTPSSLTSTPLHACR
jgi:DNA modification methylase